MKHSADKPVESPKKRRRVKKEGKLTGYEWFRSIGSPRYILAPMVNASELSFRVLCKNHNTQLLYTPMINAHNFEESRKYRKRCFRSNIKDTPLIIQFSGNDPQNVHESVRLALEMEDRWIESGVIPERNLCAVSFNLGCPQRIAQRGHYGSFLMEEQDLIEKIVSTIANDPEIRIPITCKIRIFPEWSKTEAYVKMLVRAGASMLVVHGRTRKLKGEGECDKETVKRIKSIIHEVPVILNGISKEVKCKEDVDRILEESGCDGVMLANALLFIPNIFESISVESELEYRKKYENICPVIPRRQFDLCLEYLDIIQQLREHVHPSTMKGHIFKLVFQEFELNPALRGMFSREVWKVKKAVEVVKELKFRTMNGVNEKSMNGTTTIPNPDLKKYSDTFSEEMRIKYEEFKMEMVNKRKMRKMRKMKNRKKKKKRNREDLTVLEDSDEEGEGVDE